MDNVHLSTVTSHQEEVITISSSLCNTSHFMEKTTLKNVYAGGAIYFGGVALIYAGLCI